MCTSVNFHLVSAEEEKHMENMMMTENKESKNGDGEKHESIKFKTEKKVGGIKAMPFILANDVCDRFASIGWHSNLITYLTKELNMPLVKASNTLSYFSGAGNFTPLIGAFIADSFAGRYWAILVGSIIYVLGLVSMTMLASLPQLRPPGCPSQENCKKASSLQLSLLYLSLLLATIGLGGRRPCVVTFAADQIDMSKLKVESRKWNFFNWYTFIVGLGSLTALTVVVYVQDNVGWGLGFGIPTIAMAISTMVFVVGSPLYRKVEPRGSPFVRLAQVVVAAVKKRNQVAPKDAALLYENRELDAGICNDGRLLHSNQYRWLDRAAMVTKDDENDLNSPNLWRLATVHRVEEVKCIIRILPIWAAGILIGASHQNSFVIIQAGTMDRHLSPSFQIPPASMSIFTTLTLVIGLMLYERLFVPFARRFTKNPTGITNLQRIGIGLTFNILASIVAALVEIKRKKVAAQHGLLNKPTAIIPISVFWLLPQFCIQGIGEVFANVGHLEFLYDQSPESMRSTAAALFWILTGIGDYAGALIVSSIHKYTQKKGQWLPDRNLNRGKLENYYWVVSGIQALDLVYYVVCAWFYTYKPLEEVADLKVEGDVESATGKNN